MVNINKPKLTLLQQDILRLLYIKAGLSLNQNNIARYLKVSPPAVMKALPKLKDENFIIIRQDKNSKRWSIELNQDNKKVIDLKRADKLKQIYDSNVSDHLEQLFAGNLIILYGSYSRGEDTLIYDNEEHSSDIDIAIIGINKNHEELDEFIEYEKILERKIHIIFFKSFKDIHDDLKNNILNGIILSGSVEL